MKININIEKIVFAESRLSLRKRKQLIKGIEESIRNNFARDIHAHPREKHINQILISNSYKTETLNAPFLGQEIGKNLLQTLKK